MGRFSPLLSLSLGVFTFAGFGQQAPPVEPPKPPDRKDSIVVTGSYEPLPLDEAERSVGVTPVRGQTLLFNTFIDVLKLDPSLDLRQRGPNGLQADLSIRGSTFGQTLVLVNGRRMSDPQSGHHNLDLAVPLESVERIEVLRGAGSTLYGSDAVGGVVNLITSAPEAGEIRLQTGVGNQGINQQRASITGVRGSLSQQISFSRDFSTGFIENRDYRNLMFGSATRWTSKLGPTDVDLGYSDKPFGAQGFYGNFPSWERTKAWMASIRQGLGEKTEVALGFRRHTDLFVLYRDRPQVYTNRHAAESWHGSLRRRETLGRNVTFHYGGEGFGESIVSSNLGTHDRARGAAYASVDVRALKRFSFSAGLRDEVVKGLPGQVSPTVALGYWVSGRLKLRAGASRAFRLPTFTDLYYQDPANRGNPHLRPETAWSYEGGADYRPASNWRLHSTVFHRRETDGIDYVRRSPAEVWQSVNVQKLRFTGVESGAGWKKGGHVIDFAYTAIHGDAAPLPGMQSKYAFNYAVHSGIFSWTALVPGRVALRTRTGAVQRFERGAYGVWDVSATRAFGSWRPYLQFANLTNTRYQEIVGVLMPTRSVVGGIEWVWPGRP